MALSRITNIDATMKDPATMRIRKKDTADAANAHASSTVRIKPSGGSYTTGVWVYDTAAAGGGYTHYADFSGFGPYFGVTFDFEVRDTSGGSWEVFSGMVNLFVDTNLYESTAAVPGKPTLTINSTTSSNQGIEWTTPTGAPTHYRLFRSTSPSSGFVQIGGDLTSNFFSSTGLAAATRYYYYVIPYNATGTGTTSDTVSEVTTSTFGGTETPVPTVVRDNDDDELYRHAAKYTVNTLPFAVVKMEVGAATRTASANASGVCVLIPAEKVPDDVSTVRFRAEVGSSASAWTSNIDVVDGPNAIKWAAVLEAPDDKYEAWEVTFIGDPDSLPLPNKVLKISPSPRATVALARTDAQNYLNSL